MVFADTLPDECPPSSAKELNATIYVFRIVESNPPTFQDFKSYWNLWPEKRSKWPECKAKSLSVFDSRKKCEEMLKLTRFKGQMACKVAVNPGAGMIDKTGRDGHISWWVANGYDPLQHCEVLA